MNFILFMFINPCLKCSGTASLHHIGVLSRAYQVSSGIRHCDNALHSQPLVLLIGNKEESIKIYDSIKRFEKV